MRCPWCSNPETQLRDPEIAFFEHRCISCGDCVQACPAKAIQRIGETTGSGDLVFPLLAVAVILTIFVVKRIEGPNEYINSILEKRQRIDLFMEQSPDSPFKG